VRFPSFVKDGAFVLERGDLFLCVGIDPLVWREGCEFDFIFGFVEFVEGGVVSL
jgi:hypothetical protein